MNPSTGRRPCVTALLATAALLASGCADSPTVVLPPTPVDLADPWVTASAEDAGMIRPVLERALAQAGDIPELRSLLVLRRGRLVVERYFGGAHRDELADVRSVTKSVISTLTGLALERGHLRSLDQPIGDLFPADLADLDAWERRITVRDLLTMSGGWAWAESGGTGYNDWVTAPDPLGYLLDQPNETAPGSTFAYNSASAHLLGVVLTAAVGRSLPAFAAETLFAPLGITDVAWEPLPPHINGGAGIDLRPRDLARLGQLFLQEGRSGSRQVLPPGWVDEATRARFPWRSSVGPTEASYGYLWWTDEQNDAFMAWGYGGQFIYVAPERDLVVVTTTDWRNLSAPNPSTRVLTLIIDGVLPAAPPH